MLHVNFICFVEENNIFFRLCLCILENGTIESDCPTCMQESYEI